MSRNTPAATPFGSRRLLLATIGAIALPALSAHAQDAAPAPAAPVPAAPAPAQAPAAPAATPAPAAAMPGMTHEMPAADAATPGKRTPAPADAYVYIGWPNDGEVIRTTHVRIWFGTRNFGVAPAGVSYPNTGHHHLIVDSPLPPLDEPIPNDRTHLHFGRGQTEAVVELAPGKHTLQLLMADANHVPHDPPVVSKKITITVLP